MCVAVIVQSDKRVPREYLKAMHEANPHGGGIAWYEGDNVMYRKGMSWEAIDALQDKLPRPFLMHFRIATRGEKIPELTHPFPLGMQAFTEELFGVAEKGVLIHNGTWSDYHKHVPEGIDGSKVSDTQVAAYMAALDDKILQDVKWSNAMMTLRGIKYRGQWQTFEDNLFSNMHWRRELTYSSSRTKSYDWEYDGFYGNYRSRTTTPLDVRKKGKSHQEGRHQENGRSVGQYQTQFNKSGAPIANRGNGVHTRQSNGKTVKENRDAKKNKQKSRTVTQPLKALPGPTSTGESPYDKAKQAYTSALKLDNDPEVNARRQGHDWEHDDYIMERNRGWSGERLFNDDELKGSGVPAIPSIGRAPTLTKFLGPSIPCPDCGKNITQIPCECGMDSESGLEEALANINDDGDFNVEIDTAEFEIAGDGEIVPVNCKGCEAVIEDPVGTVCVIHGDISKVRTFNADGEQLDLPLDEQNILDSEVFENLKKGQNFDMGDVEDMNAYGMNAYGMSCGLDALPRELTGVPDYVPDERSQSSEPDWREVDAAIRASGIRIVGD